MILLALAALAAPCEERAPWDAPFAVQAPDQLGGAVLQLLVRVDELPPPVLERLLDALQERDVHVGLSVLPDPLPAATDRLVQAIEAGNELVVRLPTASVSPNPDTGPPALRKVLKPIRKALGRPASAETGLGDRGREAVLHRVGLRAVYETNGPANAIPRKQVHLEGQVDNGVVLPVGPWPAGCTSVQVPFDPAAADRATQALFGARSAELGVVRLTVEPRLPEEVDVLVRWLDTVVLPAGVPVLGPQAARERALPVLRNPAPVAAAPLLGGRLVGVS
ncbi:MAG: hypothetical protein KC656_02400, partial [Myxococcales bacterium]|nr:hypothetical protein [Myxococcales bacterium]